jgi:hypothetical protein
VAFEYLGNPKLRRLGEVAFNGWYNWQGARDWGHNYDPSIHWDELSQEHQDAWCVAAKVVLTEFIAQTQEIIDGERHVCEE